MTSSSLQPVERGSTVNVSVLLAVRNEQANIRKCLKALHRAREVVVIDSGSTDGTVEACHEAGVRVEQFRHAGGYPKKRQWALDTLDFASDWILLLDADEVVTDELWNEIDAAIASSPTQNAFIIQKQFHFLGKKFCYGGFSFGAVLLIRKSTAAFERLVEVPGDTLDMEVHERVIVDGTIGRLKTPLIHEDFKGLEAYLNRHNRYSTWEAHLRDTLKRTGRYGAETITPRWFGNTQERRRAIKRLMIQLPGEPWLWFFYHYIARGGFLEGRAGLIASQIRSGYIRDVRSKMYELKLRREAAGHDS